MSEFCRRSPKRNGRSREKSPRKEIDLLGVPPKKGGNGAHASARNEEVRLPRTQLEAAALAARLSSK